MATITIDMAGLITSFELTESDALRILAAHTALLGDSASIAEDGSPIAPTPEQVVQRMAQDIVDGLAATTRRYEQDVAAAAARDAVPQLNPVIQ